MPEILEGFGERYKDVFLLNKEVEISDSDEFNSESLYDFKTVYEWSAELKKEIYGYISKNETGKALAVLVNFFQQHDIDLLNAMIIFQAQWNEGRNKYLLTLINQNDWMMIQTKVNFGILEMLKNIEGRNTKPIVNLPIINRVKNQIEDIL